MWAASVRRAASAAKYAAAATTGTILSHESDCFYETRKKIGAYDLGPTLGEGAFATVRKASKGGETYACKIINTARMNEELCTKEIEMMKRAGKHANLVSLIDVVELPDARALVLELATGGEVFERICEKGCYSEKDAALVAKQVALALKHLHGRGIAHRDLKPENLLLVSDAHDADVKLCDLGIAAAPCEKLDKRVGTPGYAAPEMLLATKKKTYDARCDLFALGVILFVLLGGYHPFDPMGDASDAILASRIKQGKWQFHDEAWAKISPEAKDVVSHLLAVKPDDRWDVDDVLASPWVAGSASSKPIGNNERLRAFNQARRTWAAAIRAAALVASAPVAAAHHSATGTLSDEARAELREAFDGLDVEGNGTISFAELAEVMASLGHGEEALAVFKEVHGAATGAITFDESALFCAAMGPIYTSSTAALRRAFDIFDADGNGSIDRDEFSSIAASYASLGGAFASMSSIMHRLHLLPRDDEAAAEKALAQMFDMADVNHDGTVSFDEFCRMFHQHVGGADPPKPRGHATQEVTAAFAAK